LLLLLLTSFASAKIHGQTIATRNQEDLQALVQLGQLPEPLAPVAVDRHHGKSEKHPSKYDINYIGNRGVEKGVNFYSVEREQALGKELSQEIESSCKLLEDPKVTDYITRLGQKLVQVSDAKVPFTIKVLDSDEINAMALPGGFFYVNSGLILAANTEAELAGVMAHEIAHVAARHGTKGATRMQIWNMASLSMVFIGGPIGMAVREVSNIAMPMTVMKFSRGFEREADVLGLEYEYAAGYDPEAFVDFFERIASWSNKKPNFVARAFASHPMTKDRVRAAQKEIETMLPPHDQYVVNTSEFDEIKAHLQERVSGKLALQSEGDPNKPVLHRRQQGDAPADSEDGPKLQRR